MHFNKIMKTMTISLAFAAGLSSMNIFAETEDTAVQTTSETQTEGTTQTETETQTEEETESTKTETTTEKKKNPSKKDTSSNKKKKIIQSEVKRLEKTDQKEENVSVDIIPKVYGDHRLEMENHKEKINGFVYFNQGDAAWNDNGYRIKQAGCGPTSMAMVITSLTGRWVTPVDTTVWAYKHGYYSGRGSAHSVIPALAEEYGLNCEGVGTDAEAIRSALKEGNPVVCLMGPGYFTKGGHFMVLVGIDDEDNVTVADVGSRKRSQYKYQLSDIIDQSKPAAAGGPFWIISNDETDTGKEANTAEEDAAAGQLLDAEGEELKYAVIEDTDEKNIRKLVQDGYTVMMMSDGEVLDGEEFIYITVVNSNGMATVTDRTFTKQVQYSYKELFSHLKTDLSGFSFWQMSGESHQFLMPFSKNAETQLEQ